MTRTEKQMQGAGAMGSEQEGADRVDTDSHRNGRPSTLWLESDAEEEELGEKRGHF